MAYKLTPEFALGFSSVIVDDKKDLIEKLDKTLTLSPTARVLVESVPDNLVKSQPKKDRDLKAEADELLYRIAEQLGCRVDDLFSVLETIALLTKAKTV